ncbi:DMT family transporter [Bosea sp. (in: a-proteobacteria)]|uniref:DMT family transporter n=1 Tax=Bosea sp. (in: a-proteobacteria) TaxID=1871050 RepID=UPI001210809F|nr:DMT family transporter [Bosea sp. (in: a-proteobacteria)]TAJ28874.1 MAG: DMT family transporter [Bosea sp. (in: a-proteobacteria)]
MPGYDETIVAPRDRGAIGLLIVTACGWGLNWTVLKFVLQDWPALFARGMAGLLGAAALAAVAGIRRESLAAPREAWVSIATGAFINVFAWMGFTALSLNWLKVSEGALIAYSMPIWAMLLAWPINKERPTLRSLLATFLGVAGLAALMGGPGFDSEKWPGIAFALSAAVLFAVGAVRSRKPVAMPFTSFMAWQVGLGCLPMVVLSLLSEQPHPFSLSPAGMIGLLYMALGPMALCYLTWFSVLKRLPTSVAATGMLIVPIVGTLSATAMLGDSIGQMQIVAIALTLSGVGLAIGKR